MRDGMGIGNWETSGVHFVKCHFLHRLILNAQSLHIKHIYSLQLKFLWKLYNLKTILILLEASVA